MLSLLLATALAHAAPVGDPVPDVDAWRVRVAAQADAQLTGVQDRDCTTATGCFAQDQVVFTGGEVQLNIVDGLALVGAAGRLRDHIDEADLDSRALGLAVGVKGALPLTPVWAAMAQLRLDHAQPGGVGPDTEKATRQVLSVTAGMAWGAIEGGFAGYVGAQATPWYHLSVRPLGEAGIDLSLGPRLPVSAVAGLSLASRQLGSTWGRSPRIVAALEGRAGQSIGAGLSLGVSY